MPHAKLRRQEDLNGAGLTRRGFIVGASVAGSAIFLNGYLPGVAEAHKVPKRGANRPTCVALSASTAVTSDDDGNLIEWTLVAVKRLQERKMAHKGKASYIATTTLPNGHRLAVTAGYDGQVLVHDLDDLSNPTAMLNTHALGDPKPEVWVAILSGDG